MQSPLYNKLQSSFSVGSPPFCDTNILGIYIYQALPILFSCQLIIYLSKDDFCFPYFI